MNELPATDVESSSGQESSPPVENGHHHHNTDTAVLNGRVDSDSSSTRSTSADICSTLSTRSLALMMNNSSENSFDNILVQLQVSRFEFSGFDLFLDKFEIILFY